ncbi:aromatic amino acid lyase [Oceanibacterium hippocampi]|uniref:MIO-dependent tyrosine 2,3-aminomutase n=1 Tax=Oceanibacterium hippocampi TaxID=745714 RepID=A0A1Y5S8G3_9PROT|nr:aromatic amino acid lyase [Oceanibacterium hippocampi]SLN34872.1 MIO-dependent tyrosine 2,3-aminomutase [Oceanibacterium hippocampi]
MTDRVITLESRADLTLDRYRRVAWEGATVRIGAEAGARIAAARAAFLRLIEQPGITVYGVTSGYGQQAKIRLDEAGRKAQAKRPPYPDMASFGPPMPERVTRGIVFARLANFLGGHAAVSLPLAEAVAALLDDPSLPLVPMDGLGGAGEILALSHLFVPLAERVTLAEKEALALINGSPMASALIADSVLLAERRLAVAEEIFALAYEAFQAPREHLDEALGTLWGDPHETATLARMRALIAGGTDRRRPYQAPVSFRILPRLLARARRAEAEARRAAGVSLAAVTDNPVYLPPGDEADPAHPNGRIASTGGYHNAMAAPAMDELAAAYADLCTLADRIAAKTLDGAISLLPDQLGTGDGALPYLGCTPMALVGYGEQARRAAARTFLPGAESGGFGQNDVATNSSFAWIGQAEAGRMLESALATLALVASQAFHATGRAVPPALAARLGQIRAAVPPLEGPTAPGPAAAQIAADFRAAIYP